MHTFFKWKLKFEEYLSNTVRHYFMENIAPSVISLFGVIYTITFNGSTRQKQQRLSAGEKRVVNEFSDPEIIGRNRRQMHHKSRSFLKLKDAKRYWHNKFYKISSPSPDVMMLTGKAGMPDDEFCWKFKLVGDNDGYPFDDWVATNFSDEAWLPVAMPGHWQLQGFDVPIYTNTVYPFTFDPPFAIRDGKWFMTACDAGLQKYEGSSGPLHSKEPSENAVGLYRKDFSLPSEWKKDIHNYRVFLVFEGAGSSLSVYLDGNYVGFSKDSCLPVEFDITDIVARNASSNVHHSHLLAAKVTRWCDASYLEDQDTWWLSGIYREVYLIRKPKEFISDVEVTTTIAENGQGVVKCAILAEGVTVDLHAVRIALVDFSGSEVASFSQVLNGSETEFARSKIANQIYDPRTAEENIVPLISTGVSEIELRVNYPHLWSAENPYLYRLYITLYPTISEALIGDHEGLHTETMSVGIRKVDIGGVHKCLRVNNEAITIAGVNRSEFDPHHGRAVSREAMRQDAILLKSLNFNAVRSSHYPQHPYWLDVCDEIGLYVIDEANIETHGFQAQGNPIGFLSNRLEWRGAMFNRVTRMFERDKNHPCVIGWSLGNEAGHGATHDLMAKWLHARDPYRFVQYESGGARTTATDIICPMYKGVDWCKYQSVNDSKERPVILCEYAHAMGNSGGALTKYWEAFRDDTFPRLQGGFIWDFVDQGLWSEEKQGFVYGGDFGEVPHSGNFCINGLVSPDRNYLFPDMLEAAYLQAPVAVALKSNSGLSASPLVQSTQVNLMVTNYRTFADLSDLIVHCHLRVHATAFQPAYTFPSFLLELGNILPNHCAYFDIQQSLRDSIKKVDGIVLRRLLAADQFTVTFPCQVYLDVKVVKKGSSSFWTTEDVTLLHTTIFDGSAEGTSSQKTDSVFLRILEEVTEQIAVPLTAATSTLPSSMMTKLLMENAKVSIVNDAEGFRVKWEDGSQALVLAEDGSLAQWSDAEGHVLLTEPVRICLNRPVTDNDKGGADFSYAAFWRKVDYANMRLRQRPTMMAVELVTGEGLQVLCQGELISFSTYAVTGVAIPWEARYIFRNDGSIDVAMGVTPEKDLPWLPRVGVRFAVPRVYDRVRWFGLGPHEAYADRCSSVYTDIFEEDVAKMHTPYVYPQENGHRMHPKWIVLHNRSESSATNTSTTNASSTVEASGTPALAILPRIRNPTHKSELRQQGDIHGYGFSVSSYSLEVIDACQHDYELAAAAVTAKQQDSHYVHVDMRMMGVGGVDSWTRNVESPYLIIPNGEPMITEIRLMPLRLPVVTAGATSAVKASRNKKH